MNIVEKAAQRHTVKAFDPARKVPDEIVAQLRMLLRLAPSSVNSQPWHFVIAATEEGKEKIARAAEAGFQYNASKIRTASHVVVLATRVAADDAYLETLLTQEERDGRFVNEAAKTSGRGARTLFTDIHRYNQKDVAQWYEKQTYLALGTLLLGAATLDVGATPMEGFNAEVLDKELGLREKGYSATVIVSLGYSGADDFNAKLPKSRLPAEMLFTDI
ncbi:oxygen-insensitive NAD(P)H nitroreductase [Pseudoduganella plicata]|uniref:Oxygen-insensitive NAD(P)H nitroreductase n=1 Tax=Pseudoduganella plicata TaxID=321984 RepID=A0A4P7B9I3_9BURK|nr:oxygen-insensitive NAD(P)H nitroreductase [Pseudoduganella plicata]QBQ35201.1 oxygen-insensitive NAD(P)H nitroreductase [Pseudoduganella plicata]GGZ05106.1 oxygen-insensitive NAD(P)H-dependent nitroreductase NfsB [Pseudoduganella plicata]